MSLLLAALNEDSLPHIRDFQCTENKYMETYIKEKALSLEQKREAKHFLFFTEAETFVGYSAIRCSSLKMEKRISDEQGVEQPFYYVFPAMEITMIAVDERYQGNHHGQDILQKMISHAVDLSEQIGLTLILLMAVPGKEAFYQRFGFEIFGTSSEDIELNMYFDMASRRCSPMYFILPVSS